LVDNLEANGRGGPLLVDGDYHASAGDGECRGDAEES
jgi:acetamidase/formamidase